MKIIIAFCALPRAAIVILTYVTGSFFEFWPNQKQAWGDRIPVTLQDRKQVIVFTACLPICGPLTHVISFTSLLKIGRTIVLCY